MCGVRACVSVHVRAKRHTTPRKCSEVVASCERDCSDLPASQTSHSPSCTRSRQQTSSAHTPLSRASRGIWSCRSAVNGRVSARRWQCRARQIERAAHLVAAGGPWHPTGEGPKRHRSEHRTVPSRRFLDSWAEFVWDSLRCVESIHRMHSPRGRIMVLQEGRTKAYDEWEAAFKRFAQAGSKEEPYAQVSLQSPSSLAFSSPPTSTHSPPLTLPALTHNARPPPHEPG